MSIQTKVRFGVLTVLLGSPFILSPVLAADAKKITVAPQQKNENAALALLVEQILNSIDKSSLDIEFDGLNFQKKEGQDGKMELEYGALSGMLHFSQDWRVDLLPSNPEAPADSQISRLYPQLGADAKNLVAGISIEIRGEKMQTQLKFYSDFNPKTHSWRPRPLTLQISNQMNKSLLSIRLHSLSAQVKPNSVTPSQKDVTGTCESDKMQLDLASGKNKLMKVDCEFSGSFTEEGYKLQFKYLNRK